MQICFIFGYIYLDYLKNHAVSPNAAAAYHTFEAIDILVYIYIYIYIYIIY